MKRMTKCTLSSGFNSVQAGFDAHIFNLKKYGYNNYRGGVTLQDVLSDYTKDYELLYHKAVKTAHLERMFVFFIGAWFDDNARNFIDNLQDRIIKRPGCNPCVVKYRYRNYEQFAAKLLAQCTSHAKRNFILQYGRNV